MTWMNEYEVDRAAERFREHPVLGPATRTLCSLRDAVNRNSDGWPYWQLPAKAASKLMELIQQGEKWDREAYQLPRTPEPTMAQLKAALTPIKAFRTRMADKFTFEIFTEAAPGKRYRVTIERTEIISFELDATSPQDAEERYLGVGDEVGSKTILLTVLSVEES